MTKAYQIALVGCGDVAHRDYLPEFYRLSERAELVGVCGRSRARAERTAAEYGIAHVYDDLPDLLANTDATIVMNLTPLRIHDEINLAIVSSGRHLYSEKTLASSAKRAGELRDLAEEHGTTIITAPCTMVWPQLQIARSIMPDLGIVQSARGRGFGGVPPWPGFQSNPTPFFEHGAGPHRDLGIYPIHALIGLLGRARTVSAFSARARETFDITDGDFQGMTVMMEENDTWLISIVHESGALSSIESNFSAVSSRAPELEVFGTKGTMALSLLEGADPVSVSLADDEGAWRTIAVANHRESGPDHIMGVEHLLDVLDGKLDPVLRIEDAVHALEILDAAINSAAAGHAVHISVPKSTTER